MELKDFGKDTKVVISIRSFSRKVYNIKNGCPFKAVDVNVKVLVNGESIEIFTLWPLCDNEVWTSFTTKDGTEFDLHIGDTEIFGDLAEKSGFFAEFFGLDSEGNLDTSECVFPKEVLVANDLLG